MFAGIARIAKNSQILDNTRVGHPVPHAFHAYVWYVLAQETLQMLSPSQVESTPEEPLTQDCV